MTMLMSMRRLTSDERVLETLENHAAMGAYTSRVELSCLRVFVVAPA
jgi:hypothetical protein